ncbi:MAG: hypothetical protein KAS60_02810 [Thermoplasmata archaeon]|nr:hypothetical protein [Thermoplasmata archaeon]
MKKNSEQTKEERLIDPRVAKDIEEAFVRGRTLESISAQFGIGRIRIRQHLRKRDCEEKKLFEQLGIAEMIPGLRRGSGERNRLGTHVAMAMIWDKFFREGLSSKEIARQTGMGLRSVQRRLAILNRSNHFHGGLTKTVRPRNSTEAKVSVLLRNCRQIEEFFACRQMGADYFARHRLHGWILLECKKTSSGIPDAIAEMMIGARFLMVRRGRKPDKRIILYEHVSDNTDPRYASDTFADILLEETGIGIFRITRKSVCPFEECLDSDRCDRRLGFSS